MEQKPTAAFVLSLVAGVFILLGGLVLAAIGSLIAIFFPAIGGVVIALAMVFGTLVLLGAILLYLRPQEHVIWGLVIVIFSILSLFPALGGFIIGMILGIVGGIMAISWKPEGAPGMAPTFPAPSPQPAYGQPNAWGAMNAPAPSHTATARCRNCGTNLSPGVAFCANCGAKVAVGTSG